MLIVNGTVHPIDAPDIPNGFVDIREGKIWRVGFMEQCPSDWEGEVLDANQGHILPGFIDAHCHLGMFGDSLGFEGTTATSPPTPAPPTCGPSTQSIPWTAAFRRPAPPESPRS